MDKLNYDSFYREIWSDGYLSDILGDYFISNNIDFIREITYDIWYCYLKSEISINICKKLIESFLTNLEKMKPSYHEHI